MSRKVESQGWNLMGYPVSFFLVMLNSFLLVASMHLLRIPLPLYVERIGGDLSQVGLVMATLAASSTLARPHMGGLVDRLGGKLGLLLGSLIFTVVPLLYTISRSVPALLAVQFLQGLGVSAASTAYIIVIAALAPPKRRGEAIGLSATTVPLSLITAPAIGASLLKLWGFVPLFILSASVAALSLIAASSVAKPRLINRSDNGDKRKSAFLPVLRLRSVWVPSLAMGILAMAYSSILTFLPLFAIQQGIDNPGLFFTAYGLTLIAAQILAGRVSDWVGRLQVIVPAMVLSALAFPVLASVRILPLLVGVAVLYALGFGSAQVNLDALMVDRVPAEIRGMAMSIAYGSGDLGIGLGAYLLGWVAQIWSYQVMYASVGVVCLLGAMVFAFLAEE